MEASELSASTARIRYAIIKILVGMFVYLEYSNMDAIIRIWDSILPHLDQSPPAVALAAIIAMGALNYRSMRLASDQIPKSNTFEEKYTYERSKSLSKYGLATIVIIIIPYVISTAGVLNVAANSIVGILGLAWVCLTITSIYLQ